MKKNKNKKSVSKFDLDKMKVVKLKNIHLIYGGKNGEVISITQTEKDDSPY